MGASPKESIGQISDDAKLLGKSDDETDFEKLDPSELNEVADSNEESTESAAESEEDDQPAEEPLPHEVSVYENFMQMMSVIYVWSMWSWAPLLVLWLLPYCLLYSAFWWFAAVYFAWFVYDWQTPWKGARHVKWLRSWFVWRHYVNYFPIRLRKTAELPPDRNYILGSHPHGFFATGIFTHLLTDCTTFGAEFPGIKTYLMTLTGQFFFPYRRDIGLNMGGIASDGPAIDAVLGGEATGRLLGIVIGGAGEILEAHWGRHATILRTRRGFCKYALKHGASLVPAYTFGENDMFKQLKNRPGRCLRRWQNRIKKVFGFCPPLYQGRGILGPGFGLLPFRQPLTTVVGSPIPVERRENPTQQEIDNLHSVYVAALVALFETHKADFGVAADKPLHIL